MRNLFGRMNVRDRASVVQGRVQGSVFNEEQVIGSLSNRLADTVSMKRAEMEGPKNQEVEGA